MPITLGLLLSKPFASTRVISSVTSRIIYSISRRILYLLLSPFKSYSFPTTFRTELICALLGPQFAYFHQLIYTKRNYIDPNKYSTLITKCEGESGEEIDKVLSYVLPPLKLKNGKKNDDSNEFIVLFAHGGGYAVGDALMYLDSFERWIEKAERRGIKLTIVSVEYPLSTQAKYPACLDAFNSVYSHLLEIGFSNSRIIFAGDSAGGGLVTMSALSLSILPIPLPQPAGSILISPWLDLAITDPLVKNSPNEFNDWLIVFDTDAPILAKLLAGNLPVEDPRISPGLTPSNSLTLSLLPPQLILAGGAEILLPDSLNWSKLCKSVGVEVIEWIAEGQVHTFSMGYPLIEAGGLIEIESDRLIIEFIQNVCN